jgi:hypothetical protein
MDRRKYLLAIGSAGTLTVAGCSDMDDEGNTTGQDGGDETNNTTGQEGKKGTDPPNFEIENINVPTLNTQIDEKIDISITIKNNGGQGQKEITISAFEIEYYQDEIQLSRDEKNTIEYTLAGDELALGRNGFTVTTRDDEDEFSVVLNVGEAHYSTYITDLEDTALSVQNLFDVDIYSNRLKFEIVMPLQSDRKLKFDLASIIESYLEFAEIGMVPAEIEGEIKMGGPPFGPDSNVEDYNYLDPKTNFEIKKEWVMKYVYGDYRVNDVINEVEQTLDLE